MKPAIHFLSSLILAALLYPVYNWKALFVFGGGLLIDIDHYFWYVYKYKKINLFKAYGFYADQMEENDFELNHRILLVFHTIEFLAAALILSWQNVYARLFTIGLLLHFILDLIYLYRVPKRFVANHSIIHWLHANKIQKV